MESPETVRGGAAGRAVTADTVLFASMPLTAGPCIKLGVATALDVEPVFVLGLLGPLPVSR